MNSKSLQDWLKDNFNIDVKTPEIREHNKILELSLTQKEFFLLEPLFNRNSENTNPEKSLGIYWDYKNISEGKISLKSFYYVGYWWLESKEGEVFIKVAPKLFNGGYEVDFVSILSELQQDPEVAKELFNKLNSRKIFGVNLSAKPIPIEKNDKIFTVFVILNFLWIVEKIAKKGLKKGYVRVSQNLKNQIKGKILIKETLQRNFMKGIHTTVVCSFENYTFDCIENRLIKTALWKINQFLNSMGGRHLKLPEVESKIGFLLNSFKGIQFINPDKRIFKNLKQSVFYKEYTLALELAKMIFQSLGFDPFTPIKEKSIFVIPYYINMALLFELYVYKKLRERYEHVFYQKKIERYIPDFLVKDRYRGSFIADAKYKNQIDKEDLKQVAFYGRLREAKNILGYAAKEETSIKIILPTVGRACEEQDYSSLTNVRIKYIPIPTRKFE